MPSDLFTIKPLTAELNNLLKNGKIQKITQPESDEIRFDIKNLGQKFTLVISANSNAPRCHLTTDKKDNPTTAPAFCMHLRKHLKSSTINNISISNNDRIITILFESQNELYDNNQYYLHFELMNRYSNIILTDINGIISDCLYRINFDVEAPRVLIPSMQYYFPPKLDKAELFEFEKIKNLLHHSNEENVISALLKNINGLSKTTATELAFQANLTIPFTSTKIDNLIKVLQKYENIFDTKYFHPCVCDNFSDFFVFPYSSLKKTHTFTFYDTLNEVAELHFLKKDNKIRINSLSKNIVSLTNRHYNKLVKKLGYANEKLKECNNKEIIKVKGDLLTANLYRIKKGDTEVTLENYYDNYAPIKIELDNRKTPQQNASSYYNKYAKLKRAEVFTLVQIKQLNVEINYINSIIESLNRATVEDIADIRKELADLGIIKKQATKRNEKQSKPSSPKQYKLNDFTIFVGTNNRLNDFVTFNIANSNDIWLHTKNEHGCHAIIRNDKALTNEVLITVAEIVAFYSSAKNSNNVAVDYTERKNVRRIKNAGLGMVTYANYKTVFVNPDEHLELLQANI